MPPPSVKNSGRPAPRWYRISKKIFTNVENAVLTILLLKGYANDAPAMAIIKIITSTIIENLDTILANGERYAPAEEITEPSKN